VQTRAGRRTWEGISVSDALSPSTGPLSPGWQPPAVDIEQAHPARIYDYFLGGKDNLSVDRAAAERALKILPELRAMARANRAFLGRAVRYLAESGVTQFLDIGTGVPGPGNAGEVARATDPASRVVYVDYDPGVAAYSRALLAGADPGRTAVVLADLRDPPSILDRDDVRTVLDFELPIAVLMVAVLHFITDAEDPAGLAKTYMDALAPGSHLVVTHITDDFESERAKAGAAAYRAIAPLIVRGRESIACFFDGLELAEPGLVRMPAWRPDGPIPEESDQVWGYCGVGRKG
jgi:SAM-dependent methyltransferase